MKTKILLFIGLILLSCSFANSNGANTANNSSQEVSMTVLASPDLYNLIMNWTNEYNRINPNLKINVIKSADNTISGTLNSGTGIGFVTGDVYAASHNQSLWNVVVGRDVIVPIMNVKNPLLVEIANKGITAQKLLQALENPEHRTWGVLLGNEYDTPLHYYSMNDPSIESAVTNFLNSHQLKIGGINVISSDEMISAVQNDPAAIGFCRLTDVTDLTSQGLVNGIRLIPIDKNGNGVVDRMENIYGNLENFTRGVWIGKYPKILSGKIYALSSGKPKNNAEVAFLQWVLNDGQQYLNTNGFSSLVYSERQTQQNKLIDTLVTPMTPKRDTFAFVKVVLLVLIAFGIISFILDVMSRQFRKGKIPLPSIPDLTPAKFDEESLLIPKGLYFDKTHTWAFMEKDGSVKIGIDDFLQHVTGPLSRVEMKNPGEKVKKGDILFTMVQKGKQLNIYAPVSGTITVRNENLLTNLTPLNAAPYGDGWVYLIEPSNWSREIQFLSMADKYRTWIKDEFSRLKDFLAIVIRSETHEYATIALQDGGAIKDSILADLGPDIWEDFQEKFIDRAH
jgi:glycine cleavage system H lipoate-binding protein/ABC-type phosphate transport system substrate-binding protein